MAMEEARVLATWYRFSLAQIILGPTLSCDHNIMAAGVLVMQGTRGLVLIMFCSQYSEAHTPSDQEEHPCHKSLVSGHILIYQQSAEAIIPATAVGKAMLSCTMVVYGIHYFMSCINHISQLCCDIVTINTLSCTKLLYDIMFQIHYRYDQWLYAWGTAYRIICVHCLVVLALLWLYD